MRRFSDQLAVVGQKGRTLTFFGLDDRRPIAVLDLLPEPHEVCFDVDHRLLYVSHTYRSGRHGQHDEKAHEISVVDVDAHRLIDVIDLGNEHAPHGMRLDSERDLLHVSVEEGPAGPGGVLHVDLDTWIVTGRTAADADFPYWFTTTRDKAYTANKHAPYISVLDLHKRELIAKIPVAGSEYITVTPDERTVYVATAKPTTLVRPAIQVIDVASDSIVGAINSSGHPRVVNVTSTGRLLVGEWFYQDVGTESGPLGLLGRGPLRGALSVYDVSDYRLLGQAEVGYGPINIESTPDGLTAYVSNWLCGTVSIVDVESRRTIATLDVDAARPGGWHQGPHGLCYIPAAG